MSKAVVLSGGGSVGIGWQTGLLAGLADAGVNLSRVDAVIGTSAGSAVGAQLALGRDLKASLERFVRRTPSGGVPPANAAPANAAHASEGNGNGAAQEPAKAGSPDRLQKLFTIMASAMAEGGNPRQARAAVGKHALQAETVTEEQFLRGFEYLVGEPWPSSFSCTAVDAESGAFKVWNEAAGVPLVRAVTSSCAVPGLFPPITIEGRRYMDGGMRSGTNADLAKGHKRVLIITLMGGGSGRAARGAANADRELAALHEAGAELVESVAPSAEAAAIMGMDLMNPALVHDAAMAGLRQGRAEADRLREMWG